MKDYDRNNPDARPDSAPQKKLPAKPKERGAVEAAAQRSVSAAKADAGQSDAPAILQHEHLSHPANAGQLAGILGELQQSHGNAYVQQVVSGMSEPKPCVEAPASGTGQQLDEGVKAEMESAFDESFSDVRVHTGSEAQKMNEELGARAVTRGRDIYFDSSEYNPATREGKELLAHELTHVVQQRGGSQSQTVNQAGDAFEQEAERNASAIMRGERPEVRCSGSAAPAFQRQGTQQPRHQPPQRDAGIDAGVQDYPRVVDLTAADSGSPLGRHARYQYRHDPRGINYYLIIWIMPPLHFNSMLSTIDATFAQTPMSGGEMLEFHVTARRGSPIYLQVRFTLGRRNIDIRFNFPIRPRQP